tara:strand:- start:462 stop:1121 length:660 start_codon:yes stop_codon:yes gene_type:complete
MTELRKLIISNLPDQRKILEQAINETKQDIDPDLEDFHSSLMIESMDRAEGIYRIEEKKAFDRVIRMKYGNSLDKVDDWLVENFEELQKMFMSLFQSRKPRAGKTLHDLIAVILKNSGIPHNEVKNQFIINSTTKIACMRTIRERWLHISPLEGEKSLLYLVTQDEKIALGTIKEMRIRNIILVLPSDIKMHFYSESSDIITLDNLISKLNEIKQQNYF